LCESHDDIVGELVVPQATVTTHVNQAVAKLSVTSRVQAVVLAYEGVGAARRVSRQTVSNT
jgi:DNA-binding NarL/FixJ family response regulator